MDNINSQVLDNLLKSSGEVDRIKTELATDRTDYSSLLTQMDTAAKAGNSDLYNSLLMRSIVVQQRISDREYAMATQAKIQSDLLYQISDTAKEMSTIVSKVGESRTGGLASYDGLNEGLLKYSLYSVTGPGWAAGAFIGWGLEKYSDHRENRSRDDDDDSRFRMKKRR
jgi:hypothetical protein